MNLTKKDLTTLQFVIIILLLGLGTKVFMIPLLLLKSSGRSSVFTMLIFFAIELFIIAVFLLSQKISKNKTAHEIIECTAGKVTSKIVSFIFIFYAVFKIILFVTILKNYLFTNFFDGFVWAIYLLPLIIVLACFGFRSLTSIGRMGEIFAPFILISIILVAALIAPNARLYSVLPLTESSGEALFNVRSLPMWFGDYILLFVMMGRIKVSNKRFKTKVIASVIIAEIVAIAFAVMIFSAFIDVAPFLDLGQKISAITQLSLMRVAGGRVDVLLFAVWMIAIIITAGLYFYGASFNTDKMLGMKKGNPFTTIALVVIIYILSVFVFMNETRLFVFLTGFMGIFALIVQIGLPIFTLICSIIHKKKYPNTSESVNEESENAGDAALGVSNEIKSEKGGQVANEKT
ncbi:MAG: GerAB/ArcD/ProY family transporter [Firmicutes bacterium]|nr:GerAB/ArcD/ProY family transporter [Bacillota bacterium]